MPKYKWTNPIEWFRTQYINHPEKFEEFLKKLDPKMVEEFWEIEMIEEGYYEDVSLTHKVVWFSREGNYELFETLESAIAYAHKLEENYFFVFIFNRDEEYPTQWNLSHTPDPYKFTLDDWYQAAKLLGFDTKWAEKKYAITEFEKNLENSQ